jgi:TRAP-type C4-dicarboxylate transport system permease large subunit
MRQEKATAKDSPASVIVAGALLGPILPPSIPMVGVCARSRISPVGQMYHGRVVPAICSAIGFLVVCTSSALSKYPSREAVGWKTKARSTGRLRGLVMIPVITSAVFLRLLTVTESSRRTRCSMHYSMFSSIYRGHHAAPAPQAPSSHAARSTALILFLLAAAGPFSWLGPRARSTDV